MSNSFPAILREALQLSPIDRVKLIEEIYRSFESVLEKEVTVAWAKEAESRIDAYERGDIEVVSYEQVKQSIDKE